MSLPGASLYTIGQPQQDYIRVDVDQGEADVPYGVVHPGHCEESSKVGCVGGTHNEGEEPPAAHHDAHGHRVHRRLATCRMQRD